jgi:hypothetical protein
MLPWQAKAVSVGSVFLQFKPSHHMKFPMQAFTPSRLKSTFLACLIAASSAVYADTDHRRLEAIAQSPQTFGTLIYRADSLALHGSTGQPLFHYERRAVTTPRGLSAAHTTRDAKGQLVVLELADYSENYALQRLQTHHPQLGYSASVVVSNNGTHLEYQLQENGKRSTAVEDVSDPVVSGPSLFGFVLAHWDALHSGKRIPVRMLVLREKTSYGFELRLDKQANGQSVFSIVPSSWIVRLAIDPMRLTFDTASQTLVRYEGRVPPMQEVAGKLKDLDARVDYPPLASRFR